MNTTKNIVRKLTLTATLLALVAGVAGVSQAGPKILATDDWSDAPMGGANHTVVPGFCLGTRVDTDWAAMTTVAADGDDLEELADDDSIVFPPLGRSVTYTLPVFVTGTGFLDAWIDFNRVAGFEPAERVAIAQAVVPGVNYIKFKVPANIPVGYAYARLRLSTMGGLAPTGFGGAGEVEDYRVTIY